MTIYFALMGDWIKIGYTAGTPVKRIAQLQTGQPQKIVLLGTIPGERDAEVGLHEHFADFRGNGEWFKRSGLETIVPFLIKHQHPWYHCRTQSMQFQNWELAFRLKDHVDLSAYDDPQYEVPYGGRRCHVMIRDHRKKYGKDKEWETQLKESFTTHKYVRVWNDFSRSSLSLDRAA